MLSVDQERAIEKHLLSWGRQFVRRLSGLLYAKLVPGHAEFARSRLEPW